MSILGLNILGDRGLSEDAVMQDARSLGAKYHVVMNNPPLAQKLLDLGANVIYRFWPDDNIQGSSDPRKRVRDMDKIAPKGCSLYLLNEPNKADVAQLNTWTLAAIDECEKIGRKAVILNFATGNPEPGDWNAVRPCVERAFAGGHILGLHQYFDKTVDSSFPWHIGRERDVYAAFGDKTPQIVITELGCAVDFHPLKGWKTSLTSDSYSTELQKAADLYRPKGIYACIFCKCPPNDSTWGSFDPAPKTLRSLSTYNEMAQQGGGAAPVTVSNTTATVSAVPKPATAGQGTSGLLQTGTFVRVRSAPTINGAEVAQLQNEQAVQWYLASQRSADGFDWVWIETQSPTNSGWMARVWPTWQEQFKPVDQGQTGEMPPATPAVSGAQLKQKAQAIRASLVKLEQAALKLRTDAKAIRTQLEALISDIETLP
jgi:hypothetical protein